MRKRKNNILYSVEFVLDNKYTKIYRQAENIESLKRIVYQGYARWNKCDYYKAKDILEKIDLKITQCTKTSIDK